MADFPDSEDVLKTAVRTALEVDVVTRIDGQGPAGKFITLRRIGGGRVGFARDVAKIRWRCFPPLDHPTRSTANELASDLRDFLHGHLKGQVLAGSPVHQVVEDPDTRPDDDPVIDREFVEVVTDIAFGRIRA